MEVQQFISIAPWTIIFQILNLLLLMVLFKKYLFKPVTEILEKRQAEIEGHYQEAQQAGDGEHEEHHLDQRGDTRGEDLKDGSIEGIGGTQSRDQGGNQGSDAGVDILETQEDEHCDGKNDEQTGQPNIGKQTDDLLFLSSQITTPCAR